MSSVLQITTRLRETLTAHADTTHTAGRTKARGTFYAATQTPALISIHVDYVTHRAVWCALSTVHLTSVVDVVFWVRDRRPRRVPRSKLRRRVFELWRPVLGFRFDLQPPAPCTPQSVATSATEWPESHGVGRAASEFPPDPVPGMVPGAVAPIYTAGVSQPSQRPIRGVPMLAAVSHLLLHVASASTV